MSVWRRLDQLLRNPNAEGQRFILEETFEKLVPACPTCKKSLIHRPPDRRFMEDDRYVECENGHVWELSPAEAGEEGGT